MLSECEDRALDALIVLRLRATENDEVDVEHLPELTEKEQKALDSIPKDAVEHWLRGEKWTGTEWAHRSQVQAINEPPPKTWDDYRKGCLSTYRGGYHGEWREDYLKAFQDGMHTVFNLLEKEFPPAEVCKIAAQLHEAAIAMIRWFDAEEKNLGTFHEKMNLCKYTEWIARKALGQDVGEFQGVPRILLARTSDPGGAR